MTRVASLYLPLLPIERLRRLERPRAQPEARAAPILPVDDDPGACSVPRGGGWRPGARWARQQGARRADVAAAAATLPLHQQPPMRELGRRSEAAEHPFKARRPVDGVAGARPATRALPRVEPTPSHPPLILTEATGQRQVIAAACPAALALGLVPGMAATQARALVPDLDVRPIDRDADQALLERLARHAIGHWTPTAAVAAVDGLWLDLSGTTHLFGGEERFCARVVGFLRRLGFTARVAIAGTPGAAHALSRFGGRPVGIVPPGQEAQAISALPLAGLRLGREALEAAQRFGLERIGDLLPMPRGPLARRLGIAAVERLDQAIGRVAEPLVAMTVTETPVAERRLLEPIGTAESIGQVIGDLVDDLIERLRESGLGVRALALRLQRVDGVDQHLLIGTARATRDAKHLKRLLLLKLDRVDPGLGIEVMALTATRAEPLGAVALGAILAGEGERADIAILVDQLAGRIGSAGLFRMTAVESDVPERGCAPIDALGVPAGWPAWRRPVRLLSRPEPLGGVVALLPDHPPRRFSWRGNTHIVTAGDGPERIHGEWWRRDGEVWGCRDYFRVEDEKGARFWLFRRGDGVEPNTGDLSWYMHGLFG